MCSVSVVISLPPTELFFVFKTKTEKNKVLHCEEKHILLLVTAEEEREIKDTNTMDNKNMIENRKPAA